MSKKLVILCTAVFLLTVFSTTSVHAQTRETFKNDFGTELLGKALLYSFNYQYMAAPNVGVQAGLGALGGSSVESTAIFFPVGVRYYVVPKNGSPFITGGFVYVTSSSTGGPFDDDDFADDDPNESFSYGYGGLGFEIRSPSGLVFRGSAYALISSGEFFIWPGINIGYAW